MVDALKKIDWTISVKKKQLSVQTSSELLLNGN